MSDLYEFFKSVTIFTNLMWKSWLLLTKLGVCITINSRSVSTKKAHTFLLQGKEIPEMSLRINTVCSFQNMKSAVELNRLIEIPNIMSHGYSENFSWRQSKAAIGSVLLNKLFLKVLQVLLEDICVGVGACIFIN